MYTYRRFNRSTVLSGGGTRILSVSPLVELVTIRALSTIDRLALIGEKKASEDTSCPKPFPDPGLRGPTGLRDESWGQIVAARGVGRGYEPPDLASLARDLTRLILVFPGSTKRTRYCTDDPGAHGSHGVVRFCLSEAVPSAQSSHVDFPVSFWYFPGMHGRHEAWPVVGWL